MKPWLHTLLASRLIRYLVTGGVAYFAEIACILVAVRAFGTSAVVAVSLSFWLGTLISFFMQKLFTFQDAQRSPLALSRQSLSYAALLVVNYAFSTALVALLEPVWHLPELARTLALIVTTAWNYLAYRHIIFRSPPQASSTPDDAA